jgi:hypothetical protein
LGIGFVGALIGAAALVLMTIKALSQANDDTSDAVKKIILNYLQLVALAASLPLQWPQALDDFFEYCASVSSVGTSFLIPDCELTDLKSADVFFAKQIAFALMVPTLLLCCSLVWSGIFICCRRRSKSLTKPKVKDYAVLTCVLMMFLIYSMLTKFVLSMLKCPEIGAGKKFLMADLQEPCFQGRHLYFLLALTVPAFIVYVVGMPLAVFLVIRRNHDRIKKNSRSFRMRYGLLYLGYAPGREWWEVVIAFRKVAVVSISTFGTLTNSVDLQAFVAILLLFVSIVVHLVGEPFDISGTVGTTSKNEDGKMLHRLEFSALTVCWFTFWGGLLFFLGHEQPGAISQSALDSLSIMLVLGNAVFILFTVYVFFREFVRDGRKKKKREGTRRRMGTFIRTFTSKKKTNVTPTTDTRIVPAPRSPLATWTTGPVLNTTKHPSAYPDSSPPPPEKNAE